MSHRLYSKRATERMHWTSRIPTSVIVFFYLLAIVVSNLIVARFGQPALIVTAWILIPFDFVARDILHGRWEGGWLWNRICGLIVAGAVITVLLNMSAYKVAIASVSAFSVGVLFNTCLYAMMKNTIRFKRMVISNTCVAVIDSIMFPIIAFGMLDPEISFYQFVSKSLGAVVWAFIVTRLRIK